jgi:hypothetical protein
LCRILIKGKENEILCHVVIDCAFFVLCLFVSFRAFFSFVCCLELPFHGEIKIHIDCNSIMRICVIEINAMYVKR